MKRKWIRLARTALAVAIAWQAAAAWGGTQRAEAAREGQWSWEAVGSGAVENIYVSAYDLAVHENKPYIFYSGSGGGTVKTWDESAWTTVGSGAVTTDSIGDASLDIGQDGRMYASYTSRNVYPYQAFVRELDGGDWVAPGDGGTLSASEGAGNVGVVSAVYGEPVLFYQEMTGTNRTFVRQFDGTAWTAPVAVSDVNSNLPDITTDPQGRPAIIFSDGSTGYYKAKAVIYDGAGWQTLGNDQFSIGSASHPLLRFAADGTAYAVFHSGNAPDNGTAYLYKLAPGAGTWDLLQQWDAHGTEAAALAVDPLTDAPFVAYIDRSGQTQVKQWNGSALVDTAPLDGIASIKGELRMAFGEDGTGYLAFRDGSDHLSVVRYAKDHTPPVLVSKAPLDEETGFDAGAGLSATFDEPIKSVAGHEIEICTEAGEQCRQLDAGSSDVTVSGAVATIGLPSPLRGMTTYRATAEAGAFADLSGNPAPEIDWTFKTAPTAPDAPSMTSLLSGDGAVFVEIGAPYDGGSPILKYTFTIRPLSGGDAISIERTVLNFFTLDLTNGTSYGITVTATNGVGESDPSAETTFTPSTTPNAPTITKIEGGVTDAKVSIAPAGDGGSAITGYIVEASQGGTVKKTVSGGASPITVSGLAKGEAYSFRAKAFNANGESDWSDSVPGSLLKVPDAPTNVTAIGGIGKATVSFTPPASDGGSPITSYRVSSVPANPYEDPEWTDVGADETSAIVTLLRPGATYHFKVVAYNAIGESAAGTTADTITLVSTPEPPSNVAATAGDAKATVTFDAPNDGGKAITRYRVAAWAGMIPVTQAEGDSSPIEVTGLPNGTAITFTVQAYNEVGWSDASDFSNEVIPSTVPGAPTGVTATAGNGSATVTFEAPASDGGSAITGYTVTASPGGAQATLTSDKREATFTGLRNGTAYAFTVVARNANGDSAPSSPSAAVTPSAPSAPGGAAGSFQSSPTYRVDVLAGDESLGSLEVKRVEQPDGTYEDTLVLSAEFAMKAAEKLKAQGQRQLSLNLPLSETSKQTALNISMPKEAVQALAEAGIGLSVATAEAEVLVPAASLTGWDRPLELRIGALRGAAQTAKLAGQAGEQAAVRDVAGKGAIAVLGTPVTVETNLRGAGRGLSLTLPFGGTAPSEKQLADIGVYIEHEDGTKELMKGHIVSFGQDKKPAYAIDIVKFSTFALVGIEGWGAYAERASRADAPYMQGYGDNLFKPDGRLTRAELATILAKLFADRAPVADATANAPSDVSASHWAKPSIDRALRLGLMKGLPDGTFRPDRAVTRAEMATIVANLLDSAPSGVDRPQLSDIAGHWAESAIAKAATAGILSGFQDGTFRPDRTLTRAEAAAILNRLIGRQPISGDEPTFADVPATHWAYGDIEAATSAR